MALGSIRVSGPFAVVEDPFVPLPDKWGDADEQRHDRVFPVIVVSISSVGDRFRRPLEPSEID